MITFIKMVITGVENGSSDMIPVAFERKFDENFDEIPPVFIDLICLKFFKIGEVTADTKIQKWS